MKRDSSFDLRVQRPDGVVVHFPAVSVLLSWVRAGRVGADDLIRVRDRPWARLGDTEYGVITRRAPQRVAATLCEEIEAEFEHPASTDALPTTAEIVSEHATMTAGGEVNLA